jgi:hypothetical protein
MLATMNRLDAWRKLHSIGNCIVCGTRMLEVATGKIFCQCDVAAGRAVIDRDCLLRQQPAKESPDDSR